MKQETRNKLASALAATMAVGVFGEINMLLILNGIEKNKINY